MADRSAVLELRDVEKRFGGLPAVDGVTLEVQRGQIFAIIGPNGAGKSTLLKTVSGMHDPTSGKVVFEGTDITGLRPHEVRQHGIAKALQVPRPLPSLTTRENVALGAMFGTPGGRRSQDAALRAAEEALELVGLADKADAPVSELNLHEQRTLDLARALAGDPRLLLLDEIMAGLNPSELENSMDVLRQVRAERNVTIVWVEHVMRAVTRLADHVAVLNFGQLLTQGQPDEVMRDQRVVEAYLGEKRATSTEERDGEENGGGDARGR